MKQTIWIGLFTVFAAMVAGILIGAKYQVSQLAGYIHIPSLFLICGGLLGVLLVAHSGSDLAELRPALGKAFGSYSDIEPEDLMDQIDRLAKKSRVEGVLALEQEMNSVVDPWLKRCVRQIVDGLDPHTIRDLNAVELDEFARRIGAGAAMFTTLGTYAPTMGVLGTLVGLIQMLGNLEDSKNLGAALAAAFLGTFWGILLANGLFLPLAQRIRAQDHRLIAIRQGMIEGILSLQAGDTPQVTAEKMRVFLHPTGSTPASHSPAKDTTA